MLLLSCEYQSYQLQLVAGDNDQEILLIDGQPYAEKPRLDTPGEFIFQHQSLGKLAIRYQVNEDGSAIQYALFEEQNLLLSGETAIAAATKKRGHSLGLIGLFFKLFKSAKAVKILLAGSALAGWSIMFSWQFALVLIAVISFHELGHVWAMKRSGMKTKGMYLIPFVGGVAVGDKASTHWQQVFISMMGPLFGLAMSIAFFLAYLLTENHFVGLVASVSALINVFNLLPILPLDGGQVIKAMVYSGKSHWSYVALLAFSALLFALTTTLGLSLLSFFIFLGVIDLLFSFSEFKQQTVIAMDRYGVVFSLVWYLLSIGAFIFIILAIASSGLPGSELATAVLNS